MDTYGVLRELDYLRVAVDNLLRETMKFLPPSTFGCITDERKPAQEISGLFKEQVLRIDAVAEALKNFVVPNDHPYERTFKS